MSDGISDFYESARRQKEWNEALKGCKTLEEAYRRGWNNAIEASALNCFDLLITQQLKKKLQKETEQK